MAYEKRKEGEVSFYILDTTLSKKSKVFYNPAMKLPRDISIEIAKHYKINSFLDCMAATGIRSLRLIKEANCKEGHANDLNPQAAALIKKNAEISNTELTTTQKDCRYIEGKFDYIEIDPFGSPAVYISNAIALAQKNTILSVTATDIGVLNGRYPKTCRRRYLSNSVPTMYSKELGARILVAFIQRMAAIHEKKFFPIFCHTKEHYLKVYLQLQRKKEEPLEKIKELHYCLKCLTTTENPCCKSIIIGPCWTGQLFDKEFTENFSLIKHIKEEAEIPVVGYYNLIEICSKEKVNIPSIYSTIEKIKASSYKASRTHFESSAIKTNMPLKEFKSLLLE